MEETRDILMVVTSHGIIDAEHSTGVWFEEFAVPFDRFNSEGYVVIVASTRGGHTPIDPRSLPEDPTLPANRAALEALKHTQRLMDLDVGDFDAVFFPGGHGTMYDLPRSQKVAHLIKNFLAQGKIVAAVCRGPAALLQAKSSDGTFVVKGRRLTCFTNDEEKEVQLDTLMPFLLETELRRLGAQVETAPNWQDHVVIDGPLVTGQNPQSSASTAAAVVDLLSR